MLPATAIIDDLSREPPAATIGSAWKLFTDAVMGGISQAVMAREEVAGRSAIRMRGDVHLENNGGFVQASLDLSPTAHVVDASGWDGIAIDVFGNGEVYNVHLRTDYLERPWQSYRQEFTAYPDWRTVVLRFSAFAPYRTAIPLDTHRLKRVGLVAIGRPFRCDLAIGGLRYIRDVSHGFDHGEDIKGKQAVLRSRAI
ncbi:CIA30 family protein [Mesorhizobium sp. UC22_110]|uniref:CIA30 family protein n=2 Tax=unclassified Mesorhizobium TaxID=325217 RepID=UPI003757DB93